VAGECDWAYPQSIGGGGSAGEVAGERRRQSRGGEAAGTRTTVKKGATLNNVLHRKLPCGLGKTLGRCLGSEDRRRSELIGGGPAAAAGARAPAIVRLGLINKRLGELLWCTRKSSGACGGEAVDGREVCTGQRQWRNGGARWRMRVRARSGRGRLFINVGGRLGGLGVNHVAGARAAWAARRGDVRRSGNPMASGSWHAGEWEAATWHHPSAHGRHAQ
jgi:hypothetical protein